MIKKTKLWVRAAFLGQLVLTIVFCGAMELLFTSCQSGGRKSSSPEATAMIIAASEAKDYERMLSLADSLGKAGRISQGESNYWQGPAYA